MSEVAPRTRNAFVGVVVVWALALVSTVIIGVLVPIAERAPFLVLVFAGVILLSFVVQLAYGMVVGFIFRVAASILGAAVVMGVISLGFGLAAILSV